MAAGEIGQTDVLEVGTRPAEVGEQIENRMLRHARHALGATDGIAFD